MIGEELVHIMNNCGLFKFEGNKWRVIGFEKFGFIPYHAIINGSSLFYPDIYIDTKNDNKPDLYINRTEHRCINIDSKENLLRYINVLKKVLNDYSYLNKQYNIKMRLKKMKDDF